MIEVTDDQTYQAALQRIETLMTYGGTGGMPYIDELNDLVDAVERWETEHYPVRIARGVRPELFRDEEITGLQMIVAISDNGAIGKDGKLPWHLPEELKWFKRATIGKAVIMGKRTWESLPEEMRPLPFRFNYVLTHEDVSHGCGYVPVHSVQEAMERTPAQPIVIGGAHVYEQAKHLVTTMFVSRVHVNVEAPFTGLELDTDGWTQTVLMQSPDFDIIRYDRKKEITDER